MTAKRVGLPYANGDVSYWYQEAGLPRSRPRLGGDVDVDVCIVGAGLTGLWTAYYLKRACPDLRLAVLEKEFSGFGASGRNGGWLSAEPAGQVTRWAKRQGRQAAVAMQHAMFDAVEEVIARAAAEGIDADVVKDGLLHVATNDAQHARLAERVSRWREWGWGAEDLVLLSRAETDERVRVAGARSAAFTPHCARIQPAKLVRGLADVVERLGVQIFERTEVTEIRPHLAVTPHGRVRASYVLRATEGFTAAMKGHQRTWLPMNSSLIVTEPLPDSVWSEIGWSGAELLGDEAHAYCYLQRTPDGRIAIGGRGVPYRFGSRWDHNGQTHHTTVRSLRDQLARLFPAAAAAQVAHTWSGVLGVPRDWCATVHVDQETGLGWAGGYVGHGVTSANLAARTLRDLVLRHDTDLTRLPWVHDRVRSWEPEPLRWLGVRTLYVAYRLADRHESRGGHRTSAIARCADVVSGRVS
ncbi:NAD(P)/FAD-dependent oxidoreductase [Micromonospora sp. NBC_00858]|uniref:NAD(P)/FAD-dependent oxidoreductase n=1 Tax=Micromonospora sp. NBC_00858 TaxID=2975979 RepID=UPI003866C46D|nr:FAD-binding oxidoreductase [Micromonospora sp. NBC_00858]